MLTPAAFAAFLDGLYERDDRLERREPGQTYPRDEAVDAYALSAHVEALNTEDIDGGVWEVLEDLDLSASSEEAAWAAVRAWYLERGCVLLRVGADEYLLTEPLARRLKLL